MRLHGLRVALFSSAGIIGTSTAFVFSTDSRYAFPNTPSLQWWLIPIYIQCKIIWNGFRLLALVQFLLWAKVPSAPPPPYPLPRQRYTHHSLRDKGYCNNIILFIAWNGLYNYWIHNHRQWPVLHSLFPRISCWIHRVSSTLFEQDLWFYVTIILLYDLKYRQRQAKCRLHE